MAVEPPILCLTAVTIGVIHTLLGPDHYLPFAAMSRAGGWTARRTLGVTVACGLGHVAGSVAIGAVGLVFVFGPCEPLIPLLMVPAARSDPGTVAAVVAAFAAATTGTMVLAVMAVRYGLTLVHLPPIGRFGHALAGLAILVCGVLVKVGF